jgi:hypothetical protein
MKRSALDRRALNELQVSKIHVMKGFFNKKFVYLLKCAAVHALNSLKQNSF